jgi:ABC-type nitrate/sulfonate/bicarbonate transport system permease component
MNNKQLERWSPWPADAGHHLAGQFICSAFNVSEFIFPSPARIWEQTVEFKAVIAQPCLAHLSGSPWPDLASPSSSACCWAS